VAMATVAMATVAMATVENKPPFYFILKIS